MLPLNNGTALHADIGPSPVNCPRDISRKNKGIPHRINMITYGMRNAPVENKKSLFATLFAVHTPFESILLEKQMLSLNEEFRKS